MTLQRLLNTIGIIGVRDKLVNFTGCGGSVYELNSLSIHDYPILYCSPTGTHRVEENYTTYSIVLFYIDRLLEDNSNAVDIHSAAVEILKNIIRAIENTDGVIGVSDEYSINLFTETEKFKDRCNGAYATVEISVVNDTVCEVGYSDWNGEPGTNKFIRITTPANNNVNIPNSQRWYLFGWQTSELSTHYSVLKCVEGGDCSVLMEGDTENTFLVLEPIVNDGTSKITYELYVSNEGGEDWRNVYHLPNYFINFVNQDFMTLSADTHENLVSWETNMDKVEWKLFRNGVEISSGQTTNTSVMVEFPENTSAEIVNYMFVAGYPGGGYENSLSWTQAASVSYYFRVEETPVIPADQSAVTFDFETNCDGDVTLKWYNLGCDLVLEEMYETTWVYGTPKQLVAVAPSDRGNCGYSTIQIYAYYKGKNVDVIEVGVYNNYFKLQTSDNERIDSTATSYTINYETNYTGVTYTFGGESGTTSGGTLTLTFPENTGTSAVQMEVLFQDSTGKVLGTLHWIQNQYDTYFNILTASGQTVSAAATAFTINYETNIQPPIHYVYTSPLGVYEGDSWNQYSLTINFSANDSQSVRERTVEIGGETINWYQEVPYLNFTSYPSEITKDQQLVCFGWESNCDGKVKYELSSGATSEGSFNFVRSGRTDSMSGDCITFSANTGEDRYYKMDIYASFAGNDTNYVASDSATFRQRGASSSGDTRTGVICAVSGDTAYFIRNYGKQESPATFDRVVTASTNNGVVDSIPDNALVVTAETENGTTTMYTYYNGTRMPVLKSASASAVPPLDGSYWCGFLKVETQYPYFGEKLIIESDGRIKGTDEKYPGDSDPSRTVHGNAYLRLEPRNSELTVLQAEFFPDQLETDWAAVRPGMAYVYSGPYFKFKDI